MFSRADLFWTFPVCQCRLDILFIVKMWNNTQWLVHASKNMILSWNNHVFEETLDTCFFFKRKRKQRNGHTMRSCDEQAIWIEQKQTGTATLFFFRSLSFKRHSCSLHLSIYCWEMKEYKKRQVQWSWQMLDVLL